MEKKRIIGIMGPGESASVADTETAFSLGKKLAKAEYIILTGGRSSGVMEAAMKGAKSAGGTTIGILPSEDGAEQSVYVDIPIKTGLGNARNIINVLSSDLIVGIGIGPGTASEIGLAIKSGKPIILLNQTPESDNFFRTFNYSDLFYAKSEEEVMQLVKSFS